MSLGAGVRLGSYRLVRPFVGGGNCRWTVAERERQEFVLKEFHRPKRPRDDTPTPLRNAQLARCLAFEGRQSRLLAAMRKADNASGVLVVPVEFFRYGPAYYHASVRVMPTALSARGISEEPARQRLLLIRALARAVVSLHNVRLVHGDLKPSNVLVVCTADGTFEPRVIDFDGAYFAGEPPDASELQFDQVYTAPELLGYVQNSPDAPQPGCAADVFSLGLLIHEYWAGCPALPEGSHNSAAEAVRAGEGLRFRTHDMDTVLDRLTRRALSADPGARPSPSEIEMAATAALTRVAALAPAAKQQPLETTGSLAVDKQASSRFELSEVGFNLLTPPAPYNKFRVQIRKSKNLTRKDP